MKKIIICFTIIFITACNSNNSTNLDSSNFSSSAEKIEILSKEIKMFSEVADAEFRLFNTDGFSDSRKLSVPAPPIYDYKFVVKLNKNNLNNWKDDMTEVQENNFNFETEWTVELIERNKDDWKVSSKPKYYIWKNNSDETFVYMIIYEKEGVIFRRSVTI
ncbi:MAG: hypothetical protein KAT32_04385 [Candidatus Moranbacteria bacterium]|nr:hypothetical protein [Candidatus Moranbacteria bacterium]